MSSKVPSREVQTCQHQATISTMEETCCASQTSSMLKVLESTMTSTKVPLVLCPRQLQIQNHKRSLHSPKAQETHPVPTITKRFCIATIKLTKNSQKSMKASSQLAAPIESNQWILMIEIYELCQQFKLNLKLMNQNSTVSSRSNRRLKMKRNIN